MKYLLNTDICIFYLRGEFSIFHKIVHAGVKNCSISEITLLELIYGAKKSLQSDKHVDDIEKFKKLFNIIQIEKAFEIFAEEKVRLNNQGILIPDFDLLIGSTALSTNMKMVTNNEKHLKRLKGIQLENWTKHKFNEFIE